jgi:dTDP-4-dehydrorhamnose reductase
MPQRILILGGTGMLGHALLRGLAARENLEVYATVRSREEVRRWFSPDLAGRCLDNVDAYNFESLIQAIGEVRPEVVINGIGIIKQSALAQDPLTSITINSLLPHRLAAVCQAAQARLVQFSTDCVFSGSQGNYREDDATDCDDLYGRSKLLGEVAGPLALTLRTSIIGHELRGKLGLLEWFLAQEDSVRGFTQAIFSGFPSVEVVRIMADYILPDSSLQGIYHVSAAPISKYDLLTLVAERYGKKIAIRPDGQVSLDRSLNSKAFREKTGYQPPTWPALIDEMYRDYRSSSCYHNHGVQDAACR